MGIAIVAIVAIVMIVESCYHCAAELPRIGKLSALVWADQGATETGVK